MPGPVLALYVIPSLLGPYNNPRDFTDEEAEVQKGGLSQCPTE